jgi:sulfoxide reductase heme-binding subunit YedZ
MKLFSNRPALWAVLALPALWIVARWSITPDLYGYGNAVKDSGDWAAWLLLVTLAVTPLRQGFGPGALTNLLMRRRRDLGVASFAYAALHTVIYLYRKGSVDAAWADLETRGMLWGWAALILFVPLAITSNDASVRLLKRAWKRLHRLVYPAAILTFAHWVATAFDPTTAWIHVGILAAIEIARIATRRR